MRFEETVVQVCSPVLIGSFSCEAEKLACENIRFSSLFAARDVSRGGTRGEERGETDVFAGYASILLLL